MGQVAGCICGREGAGAQSTNNGAQSTSANQTTLGDLDGAKASPATGGAPETPVRSSISPAVQEIEKEIVKARTRGSLKASTDGPAAGGDISVTTEAPKCGLQKAISSQTNVDTPLDICHYEDNIDDILEELFNLSMRGTEKAALNNKELNWYAVLVLGHVVDKAMYDEELKINNAKKIDLVTFKNHTKKLLQYNTSFNADFIKLTDGMKEVHSRCDKIWDDLPNKRMTFDTMIKMRKATGNPTMEWESWERACTAISANKDDGWNELDAIKILQLEILHFANTDREQGGNHLQFAVNEDDVTQSTRGATWQYSHQEETKSTNAKIHDALAQSRDTQKLCSGWIKLHIDDVLAKKKDWKPETAEDAAAAAKKPEEDAAAAKEAEN